MKGVIGMLIRDALTPLTPLWGAKVILGKVWLIDCSDPHGVEYFGELFTSNIMLFIFVEYPDPPNPLPT